MCWCAVKKLLTHSLTPVAHKNSFSGQFNQKGAKYSQGSAAVYARCGGIFDVDFITILLWVWW